MHVKSVSTSPQQCSWSISTLVSVYHWLWLHCVSTPSILASIFAGCRRTTQFSTEQIKRGRESDADTTLKHSVYFLNKTLCAGARTYFTKLHKQNVILCGAGPKVNRPKVFRGRSCVLFCNYHKMSPSHDSSCSSLLCSEMQPVDVDGRRTTEQTLSGAVHTSGINPWVSWQVIDFFCSLFLKKYLWLVKALPNNLLKDTEATEPVTREEVRINQTAASEDAD